MYTKYFGFNEKPFSLTPNPRYIFLSRNHREAFAHLLYGINNHSGFIHLVGEVGTGKTTVLRTLLGQLQEDHYRTALIFNPSISGIELLRNINIEFGLDASSSQATDLLNELYRFLLSQNSAGKTVVLVVDEAQTLKPEVLEQLRLISNFETDTDKLIQIILAGQPELDELLSREELRQLNQRITVRYRLRPMGRDETSVYIRHRMEIAGSSSGVTFSRSSLKLIHLYTRGVPRMINILCDRSLLISYGDENRTVNASTVTRAIRELINLKQERVFRLWSVAAVILMLVTGLGLLQFVKSEKFFSKKPKSAEKSEAASILQAVNSLPLDAFNSQSVNKLSLTWNIRLDSSVSPVDIRKALNSSKEKKNRFRLIDSSASVDDLINYDIPFLAGVKSDGNRRYLAITSYDPIKNEFIIIPQISGKSSISKNELKDVISGSFIIPWNNPHEIPFRIGPGEKGKQVEALQKMLKKVGAYDGDLDGRYGEETIKALKQFRKSRKINDSEILPGQLTLAVLYRNALPGAPSLDVSQGKR